jgi:CheY-like chemotaxis protein
MKQHHILRDYDEDDCAISIAAARETSNQIDCSHLFDASEALNRFRSIQVRPDLISLNPNMPVMHGQQFISDVESDDSGENGAVFYV